MEDVRIYDFEFNLMHIEHNISACYWTLYENEIGTFEMHFSLESPLTKIAAENRYLVAVQGNKQAIITGRRFDSEAVLYGRTCNWILTRFCIYEKFNTDTLFDEGVILDKDAQKVCEYLILKAMGNIENFIFKTNNEASFGEVFLQNKDVVSVFSLVQACMEQDGGGHQVSFEPEARQWIFQLTKGKTLTTVLSEENKNVYDSVYLEDIQNAYEGGYFEMSITDMGEWDVYTNYPLLNDMMPENFAKGYRVTLSRSTTYNRFGIDFLDGDYIICKDLSGKLEKASDLENFQARIYPQHSGIYAWETRLNAKNETEAKQCLTKMQGQKQIVFKTRGIAYGKDYLLGDSMLQKITKGTFAFTKNRRITGVNLWYEANDVGEQPIFAEEGRY